MISTLFEFSGQKLDNKLRENATFQSIPNQKWWILENFKLANSHFLPNLMGWKVNFSENCVSFLAGKFKCSWNQSKKLTFWKNSPLLLFLLFFTLFYSFLLFFTFFLLFFTLFQVSKVGVFSCGPGPLTNSISDACEVVNSQRKLPFFIHHYENFG